GFEKDHDPGLLATFLEENADIDGILKLPGQARPPAIAASVELAGTKGDGEGAVRIGVARDRAFCFYYHENLLELERHGADLVYFSPLKDQLPDVEGLYIGGGYPELYASELERAPARKQIKKASEDGMPIYGECGGLMYLGAALESEAGSFKMAGALPCTTFMEKRLMALGYVKAEVSERNPLADVGRSLRGHEFHYSRCICDRDARYCLKLSRGKGIADGRDGLVENNTMAGYLHAHFYSVSDNKFIESCRAYRRS
ncbi:MAG: cobyrinic acid a,c-diamide synthase, partial [Euryarchaeota archaeon]|nr:cobyrinic acid a,c-diamide synthase [Euryarchaeota archaeon]